MISIIPEIKVMKRIYEVISLLIAFLLTLPTISLADQFKVTRVYDGDTIMAEGHDVVIYVLLAGIDAPEIGSRKQERQQPYGQEAKRYLEKLILNKVVDTKGYGNGPYPSNYLIGEIYLKDININIEMIKQGLAEVCRESPPDGLAIAPYLEAERKAKAAGCGMWLLGEKYISPRDWREMYKETYDVR
jgi:micrococcal nuclease